MQPTKAQPVNGKPESAVVVLSSTSPSISLSSRTVRDIVATAFRHRKLLCSVLLGIIVIAVLAALFLPRQYESQAKILVTHERLDPVVTPGAPPQVAARDYIGGEELNSEVELIQSQDLLRKVVLSAGVAGTQNQDHVDERAAARAVQELRARLKVEAVRKTNVITIAYSSSSPERSAQIVNTLVGSYLEKHIALHRVSDELDFFDQQLTHYRQELEKSEAALAAFSQDHDAVSPATQREALLQKHSEFNANLQQTRSAMAETKERIRTLEKLRTITPPRHTTQQKSADNPQLLQDLKATLLRLERKRTELLAKYQPTYRPVQELEREIAQTKAAIASAEDTPLRDLTTDINPVYLWIDSELAKSRAELRSLEVRGGNLGSIVADYNRDAQRMDREQLRQQDLVRNAKAAEENYLLYARKREEARIANAMDQRRFLNVSLMQAATTPYLPKRSGMFYLFSGLLLAVFVTVGLVFYLDRTDDTFRTPHELEYLLKVPVAALPTDNRLTAHAGSHPNSAVASSPDS